jgi:hypothetical protein
MMIDDDAGGVTGTCMRFVIQEWLMNHVQKEFPIEPTDTTVGDPCIPVDGNFFIWTSTNMIFISMQVQEAD